MSTCPTCGRRPSERHADITSELYAPKGSADALRAEVARLRGALPKLALDAFSEGHSVGLGDGHPLAPRRGDLAVYWRDESWVEDEVRAVLAGTEEEGRND